MEILTKMKENFEQEKRVFTVEHEKLQNSFKENLKSYESQMKELKKRVLIVFFIFKYI